MGRGIGVSIALWAGLAWAGDTPATAPGIELGATLERDTFLDLPQPPGFLSGLELAWDLGGFELTLDPGGGSDAPRQLLTLDGFTLTDPRNGSATFALPAGLLDRAEILLAGLPPSCGPADSTVLRLRLPSGLEALGLQAGFRAAPRTFRFEDFQEGERLPGGRAASWYQAWVGGAVPLLPRRLGLVVALALDRLEAPSALVEDLFHPSSEEPRSMPQLSAWRLGYLGKLTWMPTEGQVVSLLATGRPGWAENVMQSPWVAPEAELDAFSDGWLVGLGWQARWRPDFVQDTRLAFSEHTLAETPHSGCTALDAAACAAHRDGYRIELLSGNAAEDSLRRGRRLAAETSFSGRIEGRVADHRLGAGVQFARTWVLFQESLPGGAVYGDQSGRPYRVTRLVPGDDGRIHPAKDEFLQNGLGLHAFDELVFGPLRVRVGLRADAFWLAREGQLGEHRFTHFGPMLAMAWDPFRDGRSALRLGYARGVIDPGMAGFEQLPFLSQAFETYEYNPATQEYDIFVHRSVARVPPPLSSTPIWHTPKDKVHLGLWREVWPGLDASADLVWRHSRAQSKVDSDLVTIVLNELTLRALVRRRLSAGWHATLTYGWRRFDARQDWPSGWLPTFVDSKYVVDGHLLALVGTYRGTWGLGAAVGLRWLRGATLAGPGGLEPDLGELLRTNASGSLVWPEEDDDLVRLDLRLSWSLEELVGYRVEAVADLFVWLDPDPSLTSDLWLSLGARFLM